MDRPIDGFGTRKPAAEASDLGAAAEAWRGFLIDLPLSLTCLPQTLASDALHYAGRRLNAQADHLELLSRCRSLAEAAKLQTDFATEALADFQRTAGMVFDDARTAVSGDGSSS